LADDGRRKRGGNAAMSQSAKVQEPSMEEILASIRRIIADDDVKKPAAAAQPAPPPRPVPAPPPPRPVTPPPPPRPAAAAPAVPPQRREESEIKSDIDGVLGQPAPASGNGAAHPDSDILDLTEDMKSVSAASFRTIDGQPDVIFADSAPEPEPEPMREEPKSRAELTEALEEAARRMPREDDQQRLLSNSATAAVDTAFNALAQTVLVQNGRTLDDLVREMLRPMLKSWLDDNLPGLVERLVRAEIERVSRGR
jgi:uncharacterized protein